MALPIDARDSTGKFIFPTSKEWEAYQNKTDQEKATFDKIVIDNGLDTLGNVSAREREAATTAAELAQLGKEKQLIRDLADTNATDGLTVEESLDVIYSFYGDTIEDTEGLDDFTLEYVEKVTAEAKAAAEKSAADIKAKVEQEKQRRQREERDENLDWRVRLHLAEDANYLYKATSKKERGILDPLYKTNGLIFPYTPQIGVQYNANYANYDLVHSNYRGYFYTGSSVPTVIVTADFTANDLQEANYLLASLHFLRSCTKMFYGNSSRRGMPPPVLFLTGYGEYQFKDHPCVVSMINYNLPNDVDYIPAGNVEDDSVITTGSEGAKLEITNTSSARLKGTGAAKGAEKRAATATDSAGTNLQGDDTIRVYKGLTYVPTKITINFTMLPIQTRKQVSDEFSLEEYGSGKLLNKGIW